MIDKIEDRSGAQNKIDGDQYITVNDGATGYRNAITISDGDFRIGSSTVQGYYATRMGDFDISDRISSGGTLQVRWAQSKATGNNLLITCKWRLWVNVE
jgi:hypothetical protein